MKKTKLNPLKIGYIQNVDVSESFLKKYNFNVEQMNDAIGSITSFDIIAYDEYDQFNGQKSEIFELDSIIKINNTETPVTFKSRKNGNSWLIFDTV